MDIDDLELQDMVEDVPETSEGSDHQDQDQLQVKRPAITNAAIQEINEEHNLFLHNPSNEEMFLGILKAIGPDASEREINHAGEYLGIGSEVILHWKQMLEAKGLFPVPVVPVPVPSDHSQVPSDSSQPSDRSSDRSQTAVCQPQTQQDGVVEENGPIDDAIRNQEALDRLDERFARKRQIRRSAARQVNREWRYLDPIADQRFFASTAFLAEWMRQLREERQ